MAAAGGGGAKGAKSTNVKVAVRCRPMNSREKKLKSKCIVDMPDGLRTSLTHPSDPNRAPNEFTFDHSYFIGTDQDTVYRDLGKPILEKAMTGFNGTIFAYGQTGAGKSWSMMGDDEGKYPGIIPKLNEELFEFVDRTKAASPNKQFLVSVSYLEIYNEVIKDLLNPSDKQLKIRQHPKLGIYVSDLATLVVKSGTEVRQLVEQGTQVRHVAATQMNNRSSRSHSCFTIKVEQKAVEEMKLQNGNTKQKTTTTTAKINLVDLAGSERVAKTGASGQRLKEGAAINLSLTTLGNVINALADQKKGKHIPYRDSKLTRLLQDSLGGNALTVMVAAISPADDNYDETLSTLRYANRAKQIKNKAHRNEDVNQAIIRELRETIEDLQRQLEQAREAAASGTAAAGAGGGAGGPSGEGAPGELVQQLQDTIASLQHARHQDWQEQQKLSAKFEEERTKNLANQDKVKSVMKTVKEDNIALLKQMKALNKELKAVTGNYKALKHQHQETHDEMAGALQRYQELQAAGGPEFEAQEQTMMDEIGQMHARFEGQEQALTELRGRRDDLRGQLDDLRAEAAAQRKLLEEDAELRKSIQEEERRRLEKEAEAQLKARLDEELALLRSRAEEERQRLQEEVADGVADKEEVRRLQMELVDLRARNGELDAQLRAAKQAREHELQRLRAEHAAALQAQKRDSLAMFRDLVEGFQEERRRLMREHKETASMLGLAAKDIEHLSRTTTDLQRQVVLAAAWEPPA